MVDLKFALHGSLPKKDIASADEIILDIPYKMGLSDFIDKYNISQIIEDYKDKIIIINGVRKEDYKDLVFVKYPNILLSAATIQDLEYLAKNRIERVFTMDVVTSMDRYNFLKDLGIKRMVIGGELGFSLAKINEDKSITIMVNPSKIMMENGSLKSFFIRPDDIDYYSSFVDVIFFEENSNEMTYYNIYNKDKKWYGKLNEIIIGLNSEINNKYFFDASKSAKDNKTIDNCFRNIRSSCGKRCIERECTLCDSLEKLSDLIRQKEELVFNK